ncbi:class I SAM-dependent methyltransferase [Nitrospira sp. NS4]|uniref:class I SAM-dependent methyltransferase n=1 Tax=Nitrospira sp. NS4 TaxID=3414498 RepID=UPI003C2BD252
MNDDKNADLTPIAKLYEDSLEQHGVKPLGVGWRDEGSHRLRFDKLASVIEGGDPVSINDLGCGYGAFYDYLVGKGVKVSLFRGYDISERMLDEARARVPHGQFLNGRFLDKTADYGFASGIFNVRLQETEEIWRAHVERTLDNLFEYCSRGFAFNVLSTYVDYREPHLFYGDPLHFFDLCKRRYSRRVSLLHDYPLFEWTMVVKK